jgi:hypothetical protein
MANPPFYILITGKKGCLLEETRKKMKKRVPDMFFHAL